MAERFPYEDIVDLPHHVSRKHPQPTMADRAARFASFAAPKSKFARFHANQGLVLAITEVAWWIVTAILNAILYAISWRLGSLVGTLLGLVNLVFLVMLVLGIVNAANGRAKELPVIGKFKILK